MAQQDTAALRPGRDATLDAWLAYVESISDKTIDLGLSRMYEMISRMDLRLDCTVFTVAGTNGKGSTCAMLESILLAQGYRVGMHTSPHLIDFAERVRVNGVQSDDETIIEALAEVEDFRGDLPLTYFEFTGLAILRIFQRSNLDAAILEIGLGGRLDAMNAIDTSCGIVCAIGLDHTAFLGDTREKIGAEKAAIYRKGRPAVLTDLSAPGVVNTANAIGARLIRRGVDFSLEASRSVPGCLDFVCNYEGRNTCIEALPHPRLEGQMQIQNASGVLAALTAMSEVLPVSRESIVRGFSSVSITGRFQTVRDRAGFGLDVIIDVGHNPNAAEALTQNLADSAQQGVRTIAVCGMLRDKDMAGVTGCVAPQIDHWYIASLTGPRAATVDELHEAMRQARIDDSQICKFQTVAQALEKALADARASSDPVRMIIFGSFVTVAAALEALRNMPKMIDRA